MIRLNPSLVLIVASVLGLAVAVALMMVGALWARFRSLHLERTTQIVGDLARRQESIEAFLSRLEAERAGGSAGTAAPSLHPKAGARAASAGAGRAVPAQRADRASPTAVGGPTLIVVPSLTPAVTEGSRTAALELGERFGAIWELADRGQSPEAIARETGQPVGQVELILGLRRQLTSGAGERS
jgi:hypothetical protein